ncbi:dihydrodipicolinate synthase family protein [Alteromonas confluentis]|uniref:Dihydrodipicolinate synthase family protein n=1 Tax=Alteromonas confluentis TaxID=1656094 RepID=A0A1E7Z9V2_9ALTE|nr:dihydrodipicolinate synthase family protein [Alteromonas confluentis]OFC70231.1 dihydrodipicolinate synthase family protein [Alteromonas confluentis]
MAMQDSQWTGVFPAATTQFDKELNIDFDATQKGFENLLNDGVNGLVIIGTCGENNSLSAEEKRKVIASAAEVKGSAPIIAGVSEFTTANAIKFAQDAEKAGVDALMLLPGMVYVPTEDELVAHFRAVAAETSLPIMLYNNPTSYRVNMSLDSLEKLRDVDNIVAIKESASDTRRFTDLINAYGDRFKVLAGLDDVALEGLMLGACAWISGLTSAFPQESVELVKAFENGDMKRALEIYRWFMPLLHLDAGHDLVQAIKLAEEIMGRGSERVRMPRMPLAGARRQAVIDMVEKAAATRPTQQG